MPLALKRDATESRGGGSLKVSVKDFADRPLSFTDFLLP